ncbi:MAG: hypothetical protein IKW95_01800 [Lachnospiraceae bacterium]|nr:hypothetical protein [Lachnospiraceae bacterium]
MFPQSSVKRELEDCYCFRVELSREEWLSLHESMIKTGWRKLEYYAWDMYGSRKRLFSEDEEAWFTDELAFVRLEESLPNRISYVDEYIGVLENGDRILLFYSIEFTQGKEDVVN